MRKYLYTILMVLLAVTVKGQCFDKDIGKFPGVEKMELLSFTGCCIREGYRKVYWFDSEGKPVESAIYFKRKLLAKWKHTYNSQGLLVETANTYQRKRKDIQKPTNFSYEYDSAGQLISKTRDPNRWPSKEIYSNFNVNGEPSEVKKEFGNEPYTCKITYTPLGKEMLIQKVVRNSDINAKERYSVVTHEERRYNQYGDLIYSILPEHVGKELQFSGGKRHSAIESYEYIYDNSNRWTEKYVIANGKKILDEKRIFTADKKSPNR